MGHSNNIVWSHWFRKEDYEINFIMDWYLSWNAHSVDPLHGNFKPGFQSLSRIEFFSFKLCILPTDGFDLIMKFSLLIPKHSYCYILSFNRHLYKWLPLWYKVTTQFVHTELERKTMRLILSWTVTCSGRPIP